MLRNIYECDVVSVAPGIFFQILKKRECHEEKVLTIEFSNRNFTVIDAS